MLHFHALHHSHGQAVHREKKWSTSMDLVVKVMRLSEVPLHVHIFCILYLS